MLVSRSQGNDALGRPVTRTQQRGTEPARSDSFSYNGRNELTAASLGAAPYGYSYDNIGNRKTARERPKNSPTRPTGSTSTPALKKAGKLLLCRRTTPRATRP